MKSELESIIRWLEGKDETKWADQIALAEECLNTMRQRAKPVQDPSKSQSRSVQSPLPNREVEKINKAIPHVEAMLKVMRAKDRKKALEIGRAAVAEL
ncbi:MAG TPA: hypothetical protein VGP62_05365 [Bryobacteraceae bacterium]|jgi:hypothetical protein|nr:hypothetical protein [Bryobacteraceae bacterium]